MHTNLIMRHHMFFYQHVHKIYQELVSGDTILFLSVETTNLSKEGQTRHVIIVHINILASIKCWSVLGIAVRACAFGDNTGENLSDCAKSKVQKKIDTNTGGKFKECDDTQSIR